MASMTNRDLPMHLWGTDVVIPKGTQVMHIKGTGGGYAVRNIELLAELTGNTHDPKYRYAWVPDDAVTQPST